MQVKVIISILRTDSPCSVPKTILISMFKDVQTCSKLTFGKYYKCRLFSYSLKKWLPFLKSVLNVKWVVQSHKPGKWWSRNTNSSNWSPATTIKTILQQSNEVDDIIRYVSIA